MTSRSGKAQGRPYCIEDQRHPQCKQERDWKWTAISAISHRSTPYYHQSAIRPPCHEHAQHVREAISLPVLQPRAQTGQRLAIGLHQSTRNYASGDFSPSGLKVIYYLDHIQREQSGLGSESRSCGWAARAGLAS